MKCKSLTCLAAMGQRRKEFATRHLMLRRNAVLMAIWILVLSSASISAAKGSASSPLCSAAPYHQFDFWVGNWNAFDAATGSKAAHVRVDRILDGCVLREQYDGADGHRGQSFSIYDASRKVWHQTWVTNRGELLMIEGKLEGDAMVLTGSNLNSQGEERQVRGDWKPVKGGVRETVVTSTDGGKTWKPWFDLIFRPADQSAH